MAKERGDPRLWESYTVGRSALVRGRPPLVVANAVQLRRTGHVAFIRYATQRDYPPLYLELNPELEPFVIPGTAKPWWADEFAVTNVLNEIRKYVHLREEGACA